MANRSDQAAMSHSNDHRIAGVITTSFELTQQAIRNKLASRQLVSVVLRKLHLVDHWKIILIEVRLLQVLAAESCVFCAQHAQLRQWVAFREEVLSHILTQQVVHPNAHRLLNLFIEHLSNFLGCLHTPNIR